MLTAGHLNSCLLQQYIKLVYILKKETQRVGRKGDSEEPFLIEEVLGGEPASERWDVLRSSDYYGAWMDPVPLLRLPYMRSIHFLRFYSSLRLILRLLVITLHQPMV